MERGIDNWGEKHPSEYVERFVELVLERHEPATKREVEEVLLAIDGPLEEVTWFALKDYDDHVITYRGDEPDQPELRRLHSFNPTEDQMTQLKAYFNEHYTYRKIDHAALIEIPDTYNPHLGQNPGVLVGACYNPEMERIQVALKARPLQQNDRVVEDVNKLVPGDDIEDFLNRIDYQLSEEIQEEADQRLVTGNLDRVLEDDPDFRRQTVKQVPEGTHPEYAGMEAELWQKPVSKVEYIDSSQGFLQVWVPVDDPETGVVATTSADYEERSVIEAFAERVDEETVETTQGSAHSSSAE